MQKLLVAALFFAALHAHSADEEIDKAAITGAYTRAPYRNKTFEPAGEPSPVAFDPVKERVLIVFRHRSGFVLEAIGGLMARWERMP